MNKYPQFSKVEETIALNKKFLMCDSKKVFNSAEEAKIKNQNVYKCPHCGKFHRSGRLGNIINKLKKNIKNNS